MKSHRTDSISLFFGLAFILISLGYLANVYLNLDLPRMGWFIAAGLVFLGIVGAITALVPTRQAAPAAVEQTSEPEREEDADAEQAR